MLLASGGYLLYHHSTTNSSPPNQVGEGPVSTGCDCSTAPPPPCECSNATREAEEETEIMRSGNISNRRPSINLHIICPTPPPVVDRQVDRAEALIAWIYPFATYFERNVVIIHQGSTGSWGEHLFHTPPPYQTPHPGSNIPGLDYPGSNNPGSNLPGLDHPGSNDPESNPSGLDTSEVQQHPIHIHLCKEDHN